MQQQQGVDQVVNRHDDGDSAMERARYLRYEDAYGSVLGSRLGPRQLAPNDARYRLDRIHMSEILEGQGPPGPACFGPQIMKEPPVPHFQLNRDAKTYDGSTKPEDWLTDYVSAVHIAGGNRRWAVRY